MQIDTFTKLQQAYKWKEIPNCPGRYVLDENKVYSHLPPEKFLSTNTKPTEFHSKNCRDVVLIIPFKTGGGLLSYRSRNKEGKVQYVHTMNTESGLQRKMKQLEISF
jgi:hypothetical protein